MVNNEVIILDEKYIKDKLYVIRGKKVMLDSDLARIYGYSTKTFNQQVNRNIERFDDDFRFELTRDEYYEILRSQNVTLELKQGQYTKYLPYAFTEEGIYMLMTVLKGEKAVNQSKALIRIFKSMKDFLIENNILEQQYINNMVLEDHNRLDTLELTFNILKEKEEKNRIYFKGQIYDAYSFLLEIFNNSKEEIIIIDNYIDKKILDLICKTNKKVIIVSMNMNEELIKKYQSQYNNLTIKEINEFHDRFIIIDRKILYHVGASLKDLGNKGFGISKIEEQDLIDSLLSRII